MRIDVIYGPVKMGLSYPFLGISEEKRIVFFFAEKTGIVLADPTLTHSIGYHSLFWSMECFRPFQGKLTITNEA